MPWCYDATVMCKMHEKSPFNLRIAGAPVCFQGNFDERRDAREPIGGAVGAGRERLREGHGGPGPPRVSFAGRK